MPLDSAAGIPIPAFAYYPNVDAGATYEGFGLALWPHPWRQPNVRLVYALTENPDGETISFRTVNAPSQPQRCGKLFVRRLLEDGKLLPCGENGEAAGGPVAPTDPTDKAPIVGEPRPELLIPKTFPAPTPIAPATSAGTSGDAEPEVAKTEG